MKLTEAEWRIMNALWEDYPATARQIMGRLDSDVKWAYTTVKTLLGRLEEKAAVSQSKKGNVSIYMPEITRDHARTSALKNLANQAFDGAFGPLMHFMVSQQKLSKKQKRELIKLLDNEKSERDKDD